MISLGTKDGPDPDSPLPSPKGNPEDTYSGSMVAWDGLGGEGYDCWGYMPVSGGPTVGGRGRTTSGNPTGGSDIAPSPPPTVIF